MVIFCCMLIGIPIAFVNPTEGGLREEPIIGLFYVSIAGAIIIYFTVQCRHVKNNKDLDVKEERSSKNKIINLNQKFQQDLRISDKTLDTVYLFQ